VGRCRERLRQIQAVCGRLHIRKALERGSMKLQVACLPLVRATPADSHGQKGRQRAGRKNTRAYAVEGVNSRAFSKYSRPVRPGKRIERSGDRDQLGDKSTGAGARGFSSAARLAHRGWMCSGRSPAVWEADANVATRRLGVSQVDDPLGSRFVHFRLHHRRHLFLYRLST
jgi:hypothetical protein